MLAIVTLPQSAAKTLPLASIVPAAKMVDAKSTFIFLFPLVAMHLNPGAGGTACADPCIEPALGPQRPFWLRQKMAY
jgi:hypothetical protein